MPRPETDGASCEIRLRFLTRNEFAQQKANISGMGGFCFDNVVRNDALATKGVPMPVTRKTGTTICGLICVDGVVLAADTRATEGPIVADKNCEKLHKIADNIYCAGAGTSADLEHTTDQMRANIELHRLSTGKQPRVATVLSRLSSLLFQYQGYIGCALVLGGVDVTGAHLYKIHPHGSTDRMPFCAMGSGSLNAMSVLERFYRDGMSLEEGKLLAADAIRSGIFNDLGSGSNVDIMVIAQGAHEVKTEYLRNYDVANPRLFRNPQPIVFPTGTTAVLREKVEEIRKRIVVVEEIESI